MEKGSGVLSPEVWGQLVAKTKNDMRAEMTQLVAWKLMRKGRVEDILAGVSDGMEAAISHLIAMNVIVFMDEGG